MSGLDKIISQIEEEANTSAAKILEEAHAKADEILQDADTACQDIAKRQETQNRAVKEDLQKRSTSSAQMEERRELLIAKQETIDEVIQSAKEKLLSLDAPDYFTVLGKLVEKHAQPQAGELRLCKSDLERMPADFAGRVSEAAEKRGGTLTVSEKCADLAGGFLLVYGDIEENCSFDALFAADRENLQDKLHTFLFA